MHQDKLGCYHVGDLKFYSKLEAIEAMERTGIHLHWDFNEAVFDSYNWAQEPTTPILELYRQRAQQLRDQYDYLVLLYSGGADCQTVLDSFVNNDIKLDEVASFVNYEATGERDNFLNAEIFQVTIPKIKQLKESCPWLHHRIVDLSSMTVDYFNNNKNTFDWIYGMNNFFSPNNTIRESLGLKIKEWADIINQGKKLCMIWGHDKPRVLHIDGQFVFRFLDFIDNGPTVRSIAGQQPYTDELFYWTPDLPEIVIKQAHIIKNYLNCVNVEELPFISTQKSDLAYREINGVRYWLSNHGVHSLIYPQWDINTFSMGKPPSLILTPRDMWFFNLENDCLAKHRWKSGVEKIFQIIPDYWINDPKDFSQGLKGCWSKNYVIGN